MKNNNINQKPFEYKTIQHAKIIYIYIYRKDI